MSKISIIIPVYNTEKYLPTCLDSVLGQTFQDIEVVCVNDGSSDNSAQILEKYAKQDARVRIITQANQGISVARNVGIDQATGKWLAFLDSDDALPPYALQTLYEIAEKTGVSVVASRKRLNMGQVTDKEKTDSLNYVVHKGFEDFIKDNRIFSSVWNKLFLAELFRDIRFQKGIVYEDWPVMTLVFSKLTAYATTEIPCCIYRENNVSITRSSFSVNKADSYFQGIKMVTDFFLGTPQFSLAQKRIAVAVKMLVNKVYHAWNKELTNHFLPQIDQLFAERILKPSHLTWKTRWRLWRLRHQ